MSDDLVAFLRARLDEDEAEAREAADGDSGEWFVGDKWNVCRAEDEARCDEDYKGDEHRLVVYGNVKPQSEHIARHDPARVLREVQAKRTLLRYFTHPETHRPMAIQITQSARDLGLDRGIALPGSWILREITAVYGDHPDYRPEWKP